MVCKEIIGRRGSGKTKIIYQNIFDRLAEQRGKVYLILPEQATFLHEKNLGTLDQNHSLMNLTITSFRRLSRRHVPLNLMDRLGCHLLVYKLLKDLKDEFQSFHISEVSAGFVEQTLHALSEVSLNLLDGEMLREKASDLEARGKCGDLPKKLHDLSLILDRSSEILDGDAMNENELFLIFEQAIRERCLFQGDLICFDDFYDFTAAEYRIIDALFAAGADLVFSFPGDQKDPLFRKAAAAIRRIDALAENHGILCEKQYLTPRADVEESALAYLEQNYSHRDAPPFEGNCDEIMLLSGAKISDEVEGIAREIVRCHEEGTPWREIGISFRNAASYLPQIKEIFPHYGIPFYYDDAQSLLHHPVFAYCRALLRLSEERWSFLSVFALLKSGLFPIDPGDCDVFENYCMAHGIKGSRFYQEEDWSYDDEEYDLAAINEIRRNVASFLKSFTDQLGRCRKARSYAEALWKFIDQSRCADTLNDWVQIEREQGRLLKAEELSLGLDRLGELLDQLVSAFPDDSFRTADFAVLFEMGCRVQKLNTIPPGLDEVEIFILGQSRPPVKEIVFLGGVNAGVFPQNISEEGFFNRRDREILSQDQGFWQRDRSFFFDNESILVYQGITSARRLLCFSYRTGVDPKDEKAGTENGMMEPSEVIHRVKSLFPDVTEKIVSAEFMGGEEELFWSSERVLRALPLAMQEAEENGENFWRRVVDYLQRETDLADDCRFVLESLDYRGQAVPLNEETLSHYPGDRLFLNVSSMDVYRRCPFSYFAKYGLKLKERKELVFNAPILGSFFHEVLRILAETMAEKNIPWSDLGQHGPELVKEIVAKEMAALEENYFPEAQKEFLAQILTENLLLTVRLMADRIAAGDQFYPVRWEASFGPEKELEALTLTLEHEEKEIVLTGQIDRVDIAEGDGKTYFRVVDYKSGNMDLKMEEIYYGLKFQLLVYMAVIEKNGLGLEAGTLAPGGMFYLSLRDLMVPVQPKTKEEDIAKELRDKSRLTGFIVDEDAQRLYSSDLKWKTLSRFDHDVLMNYLEDSIKNIGREIYGGVDTISPYCYGKKLSCGYCSYHSVCGYDAELMGTERELKPLSHQSAMAKIMAAEGYTKNSAASEEGGEA